MNTIVKQQEYIKLKCKQYSKHIEKHSWGNIAHTVRQLAGIVKIPKYEHIRCNKCNPRIPTNKLSQQCAQARLNNTDRAWEILKNYNGWLAKCDIQCTSCVDAGRDIVFQKSPKECSKLLCPFCDDFSPQPLKHNIEYYKQWLSFKSKGKLTTSISIPPSIREEEFNVRCDCGNEFKTSEEKFKRHKYIGCDDCNRDEINHYWISRREDEIQTICKNHNLQYNGQPITEIARLLHKKNHLPICKIDFIEKLLANDIEPQCADYYKLAIKFLAGQITKKKIAKVLDISIWKVKYLVKKHGIDCSGATGQRFPRYLHNEVKDKTPDACYRAGLIAADGWVSVYSKSKSRLFLALNAQDAHVVNGLMHFLNISKPVKYEVKSPSNYNEALGKKYSLVAIAEVNGLWYIEQFKNTFNIDIEKHTRTSLQNL